MSRLRRLFPARMHAAFAIAALASAALLLAGPDLWPWPLLAWLLLVTAVGPYFPRWQLYLPVAAHGPRDRREVALTFDDGPDPRTLPHLLALLAEAAAPATFFVVGRDAAANPEAIRAIAAAGHELGNHSHTHDVFLATRGPARLRQEIEACQRAVAAAAGVRPLVYRPPVGITSPPLRRVLDALGLRCVAWSRRGLDFGNRRVPGLARRVLRGVRAGDIVLLHDRVPPGASVEEWVAEVRGVLEGLRERGLQPVALSRLLGVAVMERGEVGSGHGVGYGYRIGIGIGHGVGYGDGSGDGEMVGYGIPCPSPQPYPSASPSTCPIPIPTPASPQTPSHESPSSALSRLSHLLLFLFTLSYPALVATCLAFLGARTAALVLLALHVAMRLGTLRRDLARGRGLLAVAATVAVLLALGAILDDPRFLLAYPSLVSAALLAHFAWSLRTVPIAERFARMELAPGEELPPEGVRYCRTVTLVWCAFFAANGGAATALALAAPRAIWALYTGGVSYALIGLLFAIEYVVRKTKFGRWGPGLVDRTLARLLSRPRPEERTP